jgi:hypothetical protein
LLLQTGVVEMVARSVLNRAAAAAGVAFVLSLAGATAGQAEMWNNPALPRSPYALPNPTYRAPKVDAEDLIEGNGQLHYSGQWRHWGDSRNTGELAYDLLAPNGVLGGGPPDRGAYYRHRPACADSFGQC